MSTICNDKKQKQQLPSQKKEQGTAFLSKMQDGRAFTDYRPRCTVQFQMKNEQSQNSYDSRMFLTNNAEKLMQANKEIAVNNYPCSGFKPTDVGTMLPEKNMQTCNAQTCNFSNIDPNGIGTGRKY
jgi:hypothetical protein